MYLCLWKAHSLPLWHPNAVVQGRKGALVKVEREIWDLPLRVFHWSLVLAVVAAVITAKVGGNAMAWHMSIGTFIMALLLWRVLWGIWGSHWSRFSSWPMWGAPMRHAQTSPASWHGHTPSGAWASAGMLILLTMQVTTGLLADDEIAAAGPWATHVNSATSSAATAYHHGLGQWLLFGMVVLHLCAIAFYTVVKRRALVGPMWHGRKTLPQQEPERGGPRVVVPTGLALALATAAVIWMVT